MTYPPPQHLPVSDRRLTEIGLQLRHLLQRILPLRRSGWVAVLQQQGQDLSELNGQVPLRFG
jgi:hypothetical protein